MNYEIDNEKRSSDSKAGISVGQKLRQAREAKNLSQADVAQQLLLSKRIIEALEDDNYSEIVAVVYAKGYIKSYARLLKLPVEEILADFTGEGYYVENEENLVVTESDKKHLQQKLYTRWFGYSFAVVLFLLVLVWIYNQRLLLKGANELPVVNNVESSELEQIVLPLEQQILDGKDIVAPTAIKPAAIKPAVVKPVKSVDDTAAILKDIVEDASNEGI